MIEELGWKIIYDILNWDTQKAFVLLYFFYLYIKFFSIKTGRLIIYIIKILIQFYEIPKKNYASSIPIFEKDEGRNRGKFRRESRSINRIVINRGKTYNSKYKSAFVTRQRSQQLDNGTEDVTFCIANSTWNPTAAFPWKYARTTALPSLFSI